MTCAPDIAFVYLGVTGMSGRTVLKRRNTINSHIAQLKFIDVPVPVRHSR